MRSSKNRSRSKGNRSNNNRSVGNIINRVFDSSGPEGKVRGTPQQIIDKYNQLARDAQLGNDRVATENFQQHAEHYTRMLSEATREMEARRDQQEAQQQGNQNNQNQQRNDQRNDQQGDDQGQRNEGGQGNDGGQRSEGGRGRRNADADRQQGGGSDQRSFGDVIETGSGGDVGLVETPEGGAKPKRARAPRRPRKADGDEAAPTPTPDNPQEAAE